MSTEGPTPYACPHALGTTRRLCPKVWQTDRSYATCMYSVLRPQAGRRSLPLEFYQDLRLTKQLSGKAHNNDVGDEFFVASH